MNEELLMPEIYANLSPGERETRKRFLLQRFTDKNPCMFPWEVPLGATQQRELIQCENVIRKGLANFVAVGQALLKIRDQRLYQNTHQSFEEYCRDRWQLGRSHVHRLVQASQVVLYLSPIGDGVPKPLSESQVRPLVGLSVEAMKDVWANVAAEAGNGNITARLVAQKVAQWREAHGEAISSASARAPKLYRVGRSTFSDLGSRVHRVLSELQRGETQAAEAELQSLLESIKNIEVHGFRVIRDGQEPPPEFEI